MKVELWWAAVKRGADRVTRRKLANVSGHAGDGGFELTRGGEFKLIKGACHTNELPARHREWLSLEYKVVLPPRAADAAKQNEIEQRMSVLLQALDDFNEAISD